MPVNMPYQALLIVSFGGPERRDDVMPFLENVLRGRNVPRERMLEVAEHYYHFGGVSPINGQIRAMSPASSHRAVMLQPLPHRGSPERERFCDRLDYHRRGTDAAVRDYSTMPFAQERR